MALEIPALDQGDFEHLTITGQLDYMTCLIGDEDAILIGSSMGGYLAALYASQHARVARMVLLAPAFGFGERWDAVFGADRVAEWRARGHAQVYHYATGGMERLASDLLDDSARHAGYPRSSQPALIFHGIHDNVVPIAATKKWIAENPQARLIAMDSGHDLLDVLEAVWEQSRTFLGTVKE